MKSPKPFDSGIDGTRRVLGWIYLPVHVFLLPFLLGMIAAVWPGATDGGLNALLEHVNLIYYAIGAVFVLLVFFPVLRRDYDTLADHPGRSVFAIVSGGLLDYVLTFAVAPLLLLLLGADVSNPNNEAVISLDSGEMRAAAFFLAPIVEEALFRGVLFGSVRRRSRVWAYVLSVAAFSLYHVWQYALSDPGLLVYALQYIPVSLGLAWAYERSESLWCPVFLHMIINFVSFTLLSAG